MRVVRLTWNDFFVWDPVDQVLRYDGSKDPDPDWTWVPEKQGYVPVDTPDKVYDRRIGRWVQVMQAD